MRPPFHCDEKGLRSGPDASKQEIVAQLATGDVAAREAVLSAFHRAASSRYRTGGTRLGLGIALGVIEQQHGGDRDRRRTG
jgi:hypothetical protein